MEPVSHRRATAIALVGATIGSGLAAASPAYAGGSGAILSPAFATNCGNHNGGRQPTGSTTAGTGAVNGNLLGAPLGSALNQCGGADYLNSVLKQARPDGASHRSMAILNSFISDVFERVEVAS
ncbi:hypothetical protein [Streptomyces sp. NPDC057287]|uniref:hypothetical protein n=1 Tax=Streptomyces sp. NPDC057287 TaxID=3346086 RepID=UPI0036373093